ncbi:MAG: hypothetical protein ACRDCT_08430 [Shewanella sp.]
MKGAKYRKANITAWLLKQAIFKGEPWYLLDDTQRVHPWMLDRPVHGADGRLANHHGSPV